jgi:uracil-DNA glycosylase
MENPAAILTRILADMEAEARQDPPAIDVDPYLRAGRDPLAPLPCGGNPGAVLCSFGRDPGRDEVLYGQPQVGAAGKLVRRGVLAAAGVSADPGDRRLEAALEWIFLSNTVPYKPPGNKAYAPRVRERFRPHVARLLTCYWQGTVVLTLGTEAFQWFTPYCVPGAAEAFWKREDRYEAELPAVLRAEWEGEVAERPIVVCPLPHPSPLNRRWLPLFPELLRARLAKWLPRRDP